MNIRSITIGAQMPGNAGERARLIERLGEFARAARAGLEAAGFEVQTVRMSSQPAERWLTPSGDLPSTVTEWGGQAARAGFDYCSLGTVQAQSDRAGETLFLQSALPDILVAAENVFASVQVGDRSSGGINLEAVRQSASTIRALAERTESGFGNLRFTAAAAVPAHVPFFPASYYLEDGRNNGGPEFGLALEAADLAVQAFSGASTLEEARSNLLALLIDQGERLAQVAMQLSSEHDYPFTGLDLSMAPFPEQSRSIGHALELLTGTPMGTPGSLAAAAFFTSILRDARTRLPSVGYSGLMLPVLEDQTLADRAAEELVNLDTLLLLSAVCGLGLDTVPLPGDVSQGRLERIILDMAALAIRADKPLTARLFPVIGKQAGEPAEWPHFPYFAKGKVIAVKGGEAEGGLFGGKWLVL